MSDLLTSANRPWIRSARIEDLEQLSPVEAKSNLTTWSREAYLRYLGSDGLFLVLEQGRRLLAYAVFEIMMAEAELLRIAVHPAARRRGHARRLLGGCFEELCRRGVEDCFLEVREGNQAARRLYQGLGFSLAGIRRDYYRNPHEDAVVMWRDLGASKGASK